MNQTEIDESGDEAVDRGYTKRFVSSTDAPTLAGGEDSALSVTEDEQTEGPLMSRRAAIGGVGMGAAALVCFVLSMGMGGPVGVDQATADTVQTLRDEIRDAQVAKEGIPSATDAERGLVTAQASADQVAQMQNQYRFITAEVADAGGVVDPNVQQQVQRRLIPYFDPSVDQSALAPWYLLASDAEVPKGTGLAMSFDSGFEWVAQRPYLVSEDSTVKVTWLAVQTNVPEGQEPAVLAWSQAEYDLLRKTFIKLETGTTTTGDALRQEVKAP